MIWTQKFWSVIVFLAVLSDVGALVVNIRQKTYEELKGSSATLHCTFQQQYTFSRLTVITWSAVGTQPGDQDELILTYYYPQQVTDVKLKYEGRAFLIADVLKGKATLRLSSVTLADDKTYECRVMIPGDDEGKLADTTRLVVLEPVSDPVCEIQGTVRPGENLNLTCHSEEGSPPPSYTWERWRGMMGYRRQLLDPTTTQNGGVLSLYDISPETSGLYTCTSSNKVRMAVCKVNLTVLEDFSNPALLGAVAGSVAGSIAGSIAGAVAGALTSVVSVAAQNASQSDVNSAGAQTPIKSP